VGTFGSAERTDYTAITLVSTLPPHGYSSAAFAPDCIPSAVVADYLKEDEIINESLLNSGALMKQF